MIVMIVMIMMIMMIMITVTMTIMIIIMIMTMIIIIIIIIIVKVNEELHHSYIKRYYDCNGEQGVPYSPAPICCIRHVETLIWGGRNTI